MLAAIGYDKIDLMAKINMYKSVRNDNYLANYVKATCGFSAEYANDDRQLCEGRLNFIYMRDYLQVR